MPTPRKTTANRARAVPVTVTESIVPALETMHEAIVERAYDRYCTAQRGYEAPLEDWLAAEGELVWQPPIKLLEKDGEVRLQVDVAGCKPDELEVQVTRDDILVQSTVSYDYRPRRGILHTCEFHPGKVFRAVRLPRPIEPDSARASCRDGLLKLTARVAGPAPGATPS